LAPAFNRPAENPQNGVATEGAWQVSISGLQSYPWITPSAGTQSSSGSPSLAAEFQAALQGQTAGSSASNPAQQLSANLQSIYGETQATQSGGDQTTQGAATSQPQPHHHHHHAGDAAANTSQTLSAELMQALQAYGGSASSPAALGLSV
jgi:hypothetical protein